MSQFLHRPGRRGAGHPFRRIGARVLIAAVFAGNGAAGREPDHASTRTR